MKIFKGVRRTVNKYINDLQAYTLRNAQMIGYPTRICIDPTNYSQLNCPLCPTGEKSKKVTRGKLVYENYLKLINEIGDYLYKITFYNWGEPLLNPELFLCVKDATGRGIRTNISTNLNYYTDQLLEDMVKSGLYKLTIGLDGACQETYQVYRVTGDFNKAIEGIKKINEIKKLLNTNYPILLWQYILMKHNENEVDKARQMAEELDMQFRVKAISLDEDALELRENWYPQNPDYQKAVHNSLSKKPYIDRCLELWNSPVINWNGELFPCCYVFGDEYGMGNVFREGFKKTWNNEKMHAARIAVMGKKTNSMIDVFCTRCPQRKGYRSFIEFFQALFRKGTVRRGIKVERSRKNEYKSWNLFNGRNRLD